MGALTLAPACTSGKMAELLLGMVRGRGVGARVGRECHQGRFGADPAMAANSSSDAVAAQTAASWDRSARGEQLPGLVKGEDGRRQGLAFRAAATRRVRISRTLARHEFDASMDHSSLRQRKCQHRLASRLCAAPQILFSRLRADEPQYQGLDERLFACCDPKLPAGLREMHFNCRQGDAHAFRYARVPQPFGQPLQAFLFPW